MSKKIVIILAIVLPFFAGAQTLTFQQILRYQGEIHELYSQNHGPIQNIIDDLLTKDFIVTEMQNELSNSPGQRKSGTTFKIERAVDSVAKEVLHISTRETRTNAATTLSINIKVETNDFNQYREWINEVRRNTSFVLLSREGGQYMYRQTIPGTAILRLGPFYFPQPGGPNKPPGSIAVPKPFKYIYEFSLVL